MSRKLVTLRQIEDIQPIEGADFIEVAIVDGWKIVIKKGQFKIGDYAVYCEIDSFIPHSLAPFLSQGTTPKAYKGIEGQRLKTKRLKGQYSQGLLLSLDTLLERDLTEVLGVELYDPFEFKDKTLSSEALAIFPSFIPKTDLERIQNLKRDLVKWREQGLFFEVTEKLDGSSITLFLDKQEFKEGNKVLRVASRKEIKKDLPESIFWTGVRNENLDKLFIEYPDADRYALQGEILGAKTGSTGKDIYGVKNYQIYIFDVFDIKEGKYLPTHTRNTVLDSIGVEKRVPCIESSTSLLSLEELLDYAEGVSKIAKIKREGLVFKCNSDTDIRFKVISNKWLMKNE